MIKMIYLATPYSHEKKAVRTARYHQTLKAVSDLSRADPSKFVYSPIIHFHHLANEYDMPTDALFWWNVNVIAMEKADTMYVLALPGWRASIGVQAEIKWAIEHKKPWFLIDPETYMSIST